MSSNLDKAIRVLRGGGIVVFPTDTAFGIGCRIDDRVAVKKLFEIRNRPEEKAVPVLSSSIEMVEEYAKPFGNDVLALMNKYWPGALTIVLPCIESKVPELVRGKGNTLGVRVPKHRTTLDLIKEVGVPILGPSANFSGGKTPFEMAELDPKLVSLVDFVLPGRCKIKKPSTVIDVTKKPWWVIRTGAAELETRKQKTVEQ